MAASLKSKPATLFYNFYWGEGLRELAEESDFNRIVFTNPLGMALGNLASSEMPAPNEC